MNIAELKSTSAPEGMQHPFAADHTQHDLAPQLAWHPLHEAEHLVQFYESDTFLVQTLSEFVGIGLAAGDTCIVVATPSHQASLDERLQASGLDVVAARSAGQYIVFDATETLAQLMVAGAPDSERFAAVLSTRIARATEGQRRVRVFGEMAALLWARGKYDAALDLEMLWNGLQAHYPFVLLCAYPIQAFGEQGLARRLTTICAAHARVIPTERYTSLADADGRLRAIIQLQHKAQALDAEIVERQTAEARLRRAKQELVVQATDLRRLHDINVRLTSTLDREAVLHEVLQAALLIQETDTGLLSLCSPDYDGLTLQASQGFDDTARVQLAHVPPGGGACGTCYARRQRVVIEDVETDPLFAPHRDFAQSVGFRAVHSTPLLTRTGTIIGVLSVHFRQPHRPTEREIHLMDMYAQMATDVLETARLDQAAQQASGGRSAAPDRHP